MGKPLPRILALAGLLACGERNDAAKLSQITLAPANTPMRSECLGLDATRRRSIAVDWDDQTPLRVCLIQQADGALGFDVRLRAGLPEMRRQAMNVEIKSNSGRSASGVFPLVWNPFNGIYELQLSQGCLIGAPGGCSVTAPVTMQRLFAALPHVEDSWRPDIQLTLSLVSPDAKAQDQSPRFTFVWNSQDKATDKPVN